MQNKYSRKMVEKLRTKIALWEEQHRQLVENLDGLKQNVDHWKSKADQATLKHQQLIEVTKEEKNRRAGENAAMMRVMEAAISRAHSELHQVKATERHSDILQRAIGAVQGILAAALYSTDSSLLVPMVSLYPSEKEANTDPFQEASLATNRKSQYPREM